MQRLLKLLFLLHTGIEGIPMTMKVNQPRLVSVLRGESVTLNCTFTYNASVRDWIRVSWYRTSPRTTDITYKMNNTQCSTDELQDGLKLCTVSLKVERVSFDDSVYNYTCMVKIPSVYPPLHVNGQGTRILIYEPPEISIVDGALVADKESILTCSVKGWYAESISFTWTCPGTNNFTKVTAPTLQKYINGTSVATSQLEIVPRVIDHGAIWSCQIDHATFRQPVVKVIKLNVMYGPQDPLIMYRLNATDNYHTVTVSIITVAANSFLELNCCVDSNPASTIIWTKDRENHNATLQTGVELNCSKLWIHFQSEVEGIYWCWAHNSYGRRNTSVLIKVKQEGHLFLYGLASIIAIIIVAIIYICLFCKRQQKDPVNVTIEPSPENVGRSANCNNEIGTIYAEVRRKSPPISTQYATDFVLVNEGNSEEEEVSYADIVIHSPKHIYNQKLKKVPDVTEKHANKRLKYVSSPSPHHQVDDATEYSAVRVSRQDLRTV